MKHTVCKVVTVVFALLPVFGLFGCGEGEKYTSDDVVLINTAYYGTEMNPVYSFALKKEKDGWTLSTPDYSLAVHFEHTVLITQTGVEILGIKK